MPTVLDMAGCPHPAPRILPSWGVSEEYPSMLAGYSLLPLCRGEAAFVPRQYAYTESFSYWKNVQPHHWCFTVRDNNYRYTYYPLDGGEQLFDLKSDSDEIKNLAYNQTYEYEKVKQNLKNVLIEKLILQDSPKNQLNRLFYHEHP